MIRIDILDVKKMYLHLIFAIILFPILTQFGQLPKFIIAPYVLYLLLAKDPVFIPALIIISATGSTISVLILLTCIWISISNVQRIKEANSYFIFLASIAILPFFVYHFVTRVILHGESFISVLVHWSLFLGIFPFFYGVIMGDRFNKEVIKGGVVAIFSLTLLSSLGSSVFGFIRLSSFTHVYLLAIGILIIFRYKQRIPTVIRALGIINILLFVTGITELKFHSLFASILVVLLIMGVSKNWKIIIASFYKPVTYFFIVLMVVFVTRNALELGDVGLAKGAMDYTNFSDFPKYIQHKAFGDRGVVWKGVWNALTDQNLWWPPLAPIEYTIETVRGAEIEDIDYGAHNLPLELMRNYGFVVGGILGFIYVSTLIKMVRGIGIFKNDFILLSLVSLFFSIGFMTGLTGQSTLHPNVSFTFMGMVGVLLVLTQSNRKKTE